MSKENVLNFLADAADNEQLQAQLKSATSSDDVVGVGNQAGYEFSAEHVDEAIKDLKQQPGFFSVLAEAIGRIFGPSSDDYPETGVQPFSGDTNS
jgi:predicted ribosomally synthesized peptide with nif11-like leader